MPQFETQTRPSVLRFNIAHPRLDACVLSLIAALTLLIPLYVIRPFVAQGARALAVALAVRSVAAPLAAACALGVAAILILSWRSLRRVGRIVVSVALAMAVVSAAVARINIFEKMFHPYRSPVFVAGGAPLEPEVGAEDRVLSLTLGGETHAFPIRTMGYHHIVNDTLAGQPIAATYCTLCHTGIIYSRVVTGRVLYFTLAGINNGNALLRDRETGSIWQQSTGEAIFGPLKGRVLTVLPGDELSFALWRKERPAGLILKPDAAASALYEPRDWETHVERTRVVVETAGTGIDPHTLMLGVMKGPEAKAFPVASILRDRLIEERVGEQSVLLVAGPDGTSIRVFGVPMPGEAGALSFVLGPDAGSSMVDRQTGSTWNFEGCAVAGPMLGKCLPRFEAHTDYWFDWHNHHPDTRVWKG